MNQPKKTKDAKHSNDDAKPNPQKNIKKRFNHVACYSYPNCYYAPLGCFQRTAKEDIEPYGFKD